MVNFKDLEPDEVMGEKYSKGRKKLLLVSFRNKGGGSLGRLEKQLYLEGVGYKLNALLQTFHFVDASQRSKFKESNATQGK